jgi:hypothetical protein
MHYESDAFAIDPNFPTIIPLVNRSAFIGQRIQLSPIDILEIQRYYGCVPTTTLSYGTTSTVSSLAHIRRSSWATLLIWILWMQHLLK